MYIILTLQHIYGMIQQPNIIINQNIFCAGDITDIRERYEGKLHSCSLYVKSLRLYMHVFREFKNTLSMI